MAEFSTKIAMFPNNWDVSKKRIEKDKRINEELASIEGAVIGIKNKLKYSDKPISAKIIKDIYTGVSKTNRDFLIDEEITKLKESDLGGNYSLQKVRDI